MDIPVIISPRNNCNKNNIITLRSMIKIIIMVVVPTIVERGINKNLQFKFNKLIQRETVK